MRTFRDNGRDGLSFLGQQRNKYVPIKEDIELNVGTDDEVVHERKMMKAARSNFTFDHSPPRVVGWNEQRFYREEIRNYKAKAIRMEVRHRISGHIELVAEAAKLHDYRTVEFTFDVKPRSKFSWEYNYTQFFGRNAKQSRISLK
ncbi:MAG: hypothetical protein QF662_08840 [Phycisphaerae bacterium]|nr:hypothetical protein [Phycisphaerae bacterium]